MHRIEALLGKKPQIIFVFSRGNRTPGAAVANLLEVQARYCNSFQLMHMPREDYARSTSMRSIELMSQQWRPKEKARLLQRSQLRQHGEF